MPLAPARRRRRLLVATAVLTAGCGTVADGALAPVSDTAQRILDLWLVALAVATVTAVVVLALTGYAILRRRSEEASSFDGRRFVVVGGLVVPSVILLAMMGLTLVVLAQQPSGDGELEVTVTGNRYWWELEYPGQDAISANEIHIPVGVDVALRLRSNDVIHSLWVPELGGKTDLVPGRENQMVLRADEPGTYRGVCAEFCGLQHANMAFLVIAEPQAEFDDWLQRIAAPAVVSDARAEELFAEHSCAACHAIRGTSANGQLGPDLTHFGSRRTIGAATIPNTPEQLGDWLVDATQVKPGVQMPPIPSLQPEEVDVLVEYLEDLR